MTRLTRMGVIDTVNNDELLTTAFAALDVAIPQPTNKPQSNTDIVEFAAMFDLGEGRTLKAFYYQQAEALQQVSGDASLLHWDVRDYEIIS